MSTPVESNSGSPLKLTAMDSEIEGAIAVDTDHIIADCWIGSRGIECHQSERLFFVVAEQCSGFFHPGMNVLICQTRRTKLVHGVSPVAFDFPGV